MGTGRDPESLGLGPGITGACWGQGDLAIVACGRGRGTGFPPRRGGVFVCFFPEGKRINLNI